jgi:predicted lysophospholipase L1 biosynthesis ABC-type transport system permease subunit
LVIPETVARNRNLKIGDLIGDPEHPAYPGANALPTEFVISGIFAQPETPGDENWWGFVSLEFLESHEAFGVPVSPPLFVAPKPGQKETLDDWLEHELTRGKYVQVLTYHQEVARDQEELAGFLLTMVVVESVIAVIAAIALAGLNHIFISQRQPEFGILHALGFKRLKLVVRALQETIFTTGTAWVLSTILGLIIILYMRFSVFAPLGLVFDLFNSTPWLYTMPIPVAVLAATAGTIAWTLRKLDPVSIIERR